jgi:hypothetical protein
VGLLVAMRVIHPVVPWRSSAFVLRCAIGLGAVYSISILLGVLAGAVTLGLGIDSLSCFAHSASSG